MPAYVYIADDAFFLIAPAARRNWSPGGRAHGRLIADHRPDYVVIACNTASTLVLPQLRARYRLPFVGTVPAIKPACAGSPASA